MNTTIEIPRRVMTSTLGEHGALLADNPSVMSQFTFIGLVPAGQRTMSNANAHKACLILHAPARDTWQGTFACTA